ncbi:MAG: GNAT family N-acetyltransferase [Candidatus Nanoarchaeia archaeon]|jgi:ribosomal protein S18 acetylase RimI-like enzyme
MDEAKTIVDFSFDNFYQYLMDKWAIKNKFIADTIAYNNPEQARKSKISEYKKYIKNCLFFVAEEKKELIGYVIGSINIRKDRVIKKEGVLMGIHVKEGWRRKGIATKLFNHLKKEFNKKGVGFIRLGTGTVNNGAIRLYKKLGFVETGKKMIKKL